MNDILPELNDNQYLTELYQDYDIRFCREDEYEDIRIFLRDYWKADHIFVHSKEIFDFQHLDTENKRYNFVIAREKTSHDIHSILGFVPTYQFDSEIKRILLWPCIWVNRKDIHRKGLGTTMYYHLKSKLDIETIMILGISDSALGLYKRWNFTTGKSSQYILPNWEMQQNLATGIEESYSSFSTETLDTHILCELPIDEYNQIASTHPIFMVNSVYKSKKYYINRFFNHPIYKYTFLAIKNEVEVKAILIARQCSHNNHHCLRIVDYIGPIEYLRTVKKQFQQYLQDTNYEYADFVTVGISDSIFMDAGFVNRANYPKMVIPHYFEPFVQQNIDLDYSFKTVSNEAQCIFFKADADQDRPNIL